MLEGAAGRALWQALRRKQIAGLRFRRQFALGRYFADFVCLKARLIVEVDGSQHLAPEQVAYDERRTAWLEREGFCVMRFSNYAMLTNFRGVVDEIAEVTVKRAAEGAAFMVPGPGGRGSRNVRTRSGRRLSSTRSAGGRSCPGWRRISCGRARRARARFMESRRAVAMFAA